MRILIVEDEAAIAGFLKEGLEEEGFSVDTCNNGRQGLQMAIDLVHVYDVILLDWMLPGISGIEICRSIRKENKTVPIIFLTAKDTVDDTVFGLESGANDYLKKPFSFEELLARIKVLLRNKSGDESIFSALLEYLLRNKGNVCRRTRIIEKIWDIHFEKDTSVIDVFINSLRKKLDIPHQDSFIQTIRGIGYRVNNDI